MPKVRLLDNNKITEVHYTHTIGGNEWYEEDCTGRSYTSKEFEFVYEPDYWDELYFHYAGMAMQGLMSNYDSFIKEWLQNQIENKCDITEELANETIQSFSEACANVSTKVAMALINKVKK